MRSRWALLFVLMHITGFSRGAATAQTLDQQQCSAPDPDLAISGCTAMIQSGHETQQNLAVAFLNRGAAYLDKGQPDRAIQDYDQAIRLNPNYAAAFRNRGRAYSAKGDNDRAIADFNEAIRLDPKRAVAYNNRRNNHAVRYYNRGNAYSAKGDNDRAIADYNEAIPLDPKPAVAYKNRGNAYRAKGDNDRAIADYNEAIRLNPNFAHAYISRGLAYLYSANPAKALADVIQASELDQKNAYNALWVDIVGQRNNIPSRLSQAIAKIDMTAWPAPVIRLFLGQMTPAAVLAAADDPDAAKKKGQVCEANFFGGELALRTGAKDEATRLFRLAANDCPKSFDEWGAANAELKAVGGTR
jgi:lipoprotein NlpI